MIVVNLMWVGNTVNSNKKMEEEGNEQESHQNYQSELSGQSHGPGQHQRSAVHQAHPPHQGRRVALLRQPNARPQTRRPANSVVGPHRNVSQQKPRPSNTDVRWVSFFGKIIYFFEFLFLRYSSIFLLT